MTGRLLLTIAAVWLVEERLPKFQGPSLSKHEHSAYARRDRYNPRSSKGRFFSCEAKRKSCIFKAQI